MSVNAVRFNANFPPWRNSFEKSAPRRKTKKKIQRAPDLRLVFYLDCNTGCCHVDRICRLCQLNKAESVFLLRLLYHDLSARSSGKSREKNAVCLRTLTRWKGFYETDTFGLYLDNAGVCCLDSFLYFVSILVCFCVKTLFCLVRELFTLCGPQRCVIMCRRIPRGGRTNPIVSQSIHPFIYFTAPIISTASPDIYLLFFTPLYRWKSLQSI